MEKHCLDKCTERFSKAIHKG